jgi:hypothetical protein
LINFAAPPGREEPDAGAITRLRSGRFKMGWIDAEISDCNKTFIGLRLRPTIAQRKMLAIWLFGFLDDNIANTASMTGTVAGTIRKGLRGG